MAVHDSHFAGLVVKLACKSRELDHGRRLLASCRLMEVPIERQEVGVRRDAQNVVPAPLDPVFHAVGHFGDRLDGEAVLKLDIGSGLLRFH